MSSPDAPDLSFVIPAYNEEENIGRAVTSIHRYMPEDLTAEVIVVDNGSEDGTSRIAEESGARIVASRATTIAGVRNEGVAMARGKVLVFLDGDCALTDEWRAGIGARLTQLTEVPMSCAGSQVTPPRDERSAIVRHWFVPFMERATHLGSAHLICTRADFLQLGGFDESLETGEDYDFSQRIKAAGGKVLYADELRVDHYDFPRGWGDFIRRERWHGRGDMRSLSSYLGSKVALVSTVYGLSAILAPVALLLGWLAAAWSLLGLFLAIPVLSSLVRMRRVGLTTRLYSVPIFSAYYAGRFLSIVDAVRERVLPAPT